MTTVYTSIGVSYICQHCGRPIGGLATLLGGYAYHYECTQSPYANNKYQFVPVEETK